MKILNKFVSKQYVVISFFVLTFIMTQNALAESMHGIFMVVKGDIMVSNSKQAKQKAKVGDKVFSGDVVESSTDSRAKIVMSDRNVINISPETKLEIQKYENDGSSKNVEMNLLQGKVRNNVEQKYDGEKSKFLIKTPTAVAGVRGTQFFTSFDPRTRITAIVTLRGAVTLAPLNLNAVNAKPVLIKKGEASSMAPGANPEAPKIIPKEELKKIDQDSTASAGPVKSEQPKEVAKGDKQKNDNKGSEKGSENGSRQPAMATEGNNPPPPPAGGPKMIDKSDMDSGQFKEIRMPTADANQPKPPPPLLAAPNLPPPPPQALIDDLVRGTLGKTRVIIVPVPQ